MNMLKLLPTRPGCLPGGLLSFGYERPVNRLAGYAPGVPGAAGLEHDLGASQSAVDDWRGAARAARRKGARHHLIRLRERQVGGWNQPPDATDPDRHDPE